MGLLLSKFRKKKTTKDQLESIEQRIRSIEKFQKETEQQFRRVIGKLLFSSILIYIVAVFGFYYYYSPQTFRDNFIYFLPLLIFPILIVLFRKLLSWYYKRKLSKNETTLKTLKVDKKKILEEVMDTETYKVAKEILEKYAPDQLTKDVKPMANSPLRAIMPAPNAKQDTSVRQRLITATPSNRTFGYSAQPVVPAVLNTPSTLAQPRLSLPRPILARERGAFDRLIDLIVGDGPGNRYALICKVCSSHNGMALKHEFEYLAFRCAYCLQWNPARKQKPQAPNLHSESDSQDDSNGNESETDMNTETKTERNSYEPDSDDKTYENGAIPITSTNLSSESVEEKTNLSVEESEENQSSEPDQCQERTDAGDTLSESKNNIDLNDLHRVLEEIDDYDDDDARSSPNAASSLIIDSVAASNLPVEEESNEHSK